MNKKVTRGKKSRQVGPRIVRAWFDTVINPLLRSLGTEQELLEKRYWTWRFRPASLEALRVVRAYVDPEAWANLEQFADFHPDVNRALKEHDQKANMLGESCQQLQRTIEGSPDLREIYQRATSPASLKDLATNRPDLFGVTGQYETPDTILSRIFGAYPEEDHLALLTQYIVNNAGELPRHHMAAPLWNEYRTEFAAILDVPAIQGYYKATIKAGEELRRSGERLIRLLKEKRLQLSLEHDVPYVAVTRQSRW